MQVSYAKIQQTQFVVLQSSVKIHINKKKQPIRLEEIPLDIEFDILENKAAGPRLVRVVMTIKGNSEKTVSGYVFELRIGGQYTISEEVDVDSSEYHNLVQISAVACLINEARVYLQTLTAFFPFNSYIMPMIDMPELWKQKSDLKIETEKTKTVKQIRTHN